MSPSPPDPPPGNEPEPALSGREVQVLQLLALGRSDRKIARLLGLSVGTVGTYKARAMGKLGLRTRLDIIRYADRCGWLADGNHTGSSRLDRAGADAEQPPAEGPGADAGGVLLAMRAGRQRGSGPSVVPSAGGAARQTAPKAAGTRCGRRPGSAPRR